ncbi:MAG: hypothetical protein JO080_14865 [Mucilaginibacter sp.]|nr:hypothetical protein [Mucilaginibacter sp.]
MKAFIFLIATIVMTNVCQAQDFNKAMATAKTAYSAGKLEDAHFALQQAMQEVDLTIGKEVLKLLPPKLGAMQSTAKDDNVSSNVGFVGATIHRTYAQTKQSADITIIDNSPLIAMTNAVLNTPMLGMMSNGKYKIVKVQGYKARLEKETGSTSDKSSYELQIPLGSALFTFKVTDCTDSQIMELADAIPLQQIAKLID